jgi:hypothetical protein
MGIKPAAHARRKNSWNDFITNYPSRLTRRGKKNDLEERKR